MVEHDEQQTREAQAGGAQAGQADVEAAAVAPDGGAESGALAELLALERLLTLSTPVQLRHAHRLVAHRLVAQLFALGALEVIGDGHIATLSAASPRAPTWLAQFGSLTVPIVSPIPAMTMTPEGPCYCYQADVRRLAPEVVERVVAGVVADFGLPEAEVRADVFGEVGIPLLADDVAVTFEARLAL